VPQLDTSTFTTQIVWLAITFVLLYVLMAKAGLPRLSAAIAARRNRLDDDLARAAALKTEAEAVIAAYEHALATARAEAQATIREAAGRFAAEAAERQRRLAAELAQRISAAERELAVARQRAVADIRIIAAEVAGSVATKLIGTAVEPSRVAAAVDRVVAERNA